MTWGTTECATAEGEGRASRRPPRPSLLGGEQGQTAPEYLGIVVVVAIVIAALVVGVARGGTGNVAQDTNAAVCRVNQTSCEPGSGTNGGSDGSGSDQSGGQSQGQKKDDGCHGFWGCAWSVTKQVGSGGFNIGKGAWDDVTGLVGLVTHPGQIVDAGKYIWNHPGDALKQLVWDDESGDMWGRGDYGGAIGRTIWNVGSWFIPGVDIGRAGSKIGKFGKLGHLAEEATVDAAKVSKLADDAGTLARKAEEAAARGDTAEANKLAQQAENKADDAEKAAKAEGCPIASGLLPAQRDGRLPGTVLALAGSGGGRAMAATAPLGAFRAGGADCTKLSGDAQRADAAAKKAHDAIYDSLPQDIQDLTMSHVTNTGDTILGHFPGYIDKANARGASYFDLGDAWNGLTKDQAWAANLHFLDESAARGDRVLLSLPRNQIRPGSYLVDEVNYLTKEKGYVWVNQWSLRPPP